MKEPPDDGRELIMCEELRGGSLWLSHRVRQGEWRLRRPSGASPSRDWEGPGLQVMEATGRFKREMDTSRCIFSKDHFDSNMENTSEGSQGGCGKNR